MQAPGIAKYKEVKMTRTRAGALRTARKRRGLRSRPTYPLKRCWQVVGTSRKRERLLGLDGQKAMCKSCKPRLQTCDHCPGSDGLAHKWAVTACAHSSGKIMMRQSYWDSCKKWNELVLGVVESACRRSGWTQGMSTSSGRCLMCEGWSEHELRQWNDRDVVVVQELLHEVEVVDRVAVEDVLCEVESDCGCGGSGCVHMYLLRFSARRVTSWYC
eukprot:3008764-Amphidinium_carterae.3